MEEIKCEQVGMLSGDKYDKLHDISRRVYSAEGLAPTVHTMGGGQQELKIIEPIIVEHFYVNREPRLYTGNCSTIRAERQGLEVIEPIAYDEQNGYLRQDGCVGTLTTDGSSPKHNNRIVEPICLNSKVDGKQPSLTDRVYDTNGISTCVTTSPFYMGNIVEPNYELSDAMKRYINSTNGKYTVGNDSLVVNRDIACAKTTREGCSRADTSDYISPDLPENTNVAGKDLVKYRMRKLTERECFRLMGVKVSNYEKVAKNQSMSSQYHLAGDSIVTSCLMAIFGELLSVDYKTKIQELVEELKQ